MCRIIAAGGLVSLDFLVDCLRLMAEKRHVDGWGAVHRSDGRLVAEKSVVSCLEDPAIFYDGASSDLAVFHARKAKTGPDVNMTHPFPVKSFMVFYNARFSDGVYDPLRLARHLEERMASDDVSFIPAMMQLRNFYGANCVLAGPDRLLVCARYKKPGYYQMHYSAESHNVLVSSEPLPGRDWSPLAAGSVLALYPDGRHKFLK